MLSTAGVAAAIGQKGGSLSVGDVQVRVRLPKLRLHEHAPPVVVWLQPLQGTVAPPFVPGAHYTLQQKNRMFTPHLLVVPVGSEVLFPNADPFFHNVFSLFNGKRFDLGLYEAGTTKAERFSREGVSYLFCNIHPEMSAVIVVLSTPLYTTSGVDGVYSIHNAPAGDYELHVWVEGLTQPALDRLRRHVEVTAGGTDLGVVDATSAPLQPAEHLNKFGQAYDRDSKPAY
ncbi:MAG TPA: carboxypeptidase regulatory-like domain-containing protein [Terracidiphilus sp.]|jgi:plastocyanin|nr:carboxypeptidase regulatory-like domain-containing protein [Terracidiphilus sp.]